MRTVNSLICEYERKNRFFKLPGVLQMTTPENKQDQAHRGFSRGIHSKQN